MLDPNITYLNHGSFGARVSEVFEYQQSLKRELELSPINFLDRQRYRIDEARNCISSFLGAEVEGFGFVDNATTGVGCVVQSIQIEPEDEILTTNLVYNGIRQLLTRIASDACCSYRELQVQFPLQSQNELLQLITDAISNKTKLLVVDHVASASAIVFPVKEIAKICKERGILLLVDGAHAPGMLDLHIDSIGADWYVGNLHKWICAPLSAGFVYTSEPHRDTTHPMTISHWYKQGITNEFNWQGTKDITPWLAAAKAVEWGSKIGWSRIQQHNHAFAVWMQKTLVATWNVEPLSPLDGSMLGSMVTVPLPDTLPNEMEACLAYRDYLYENYQIEVPIFELQGRGVVRLSGQLYSREEHLKRLISAVCDYSA
ncbi:MAG TPA: aminotransferase class V-fold PLP-dependent enzyme [Phycisphaerales bacterium]|nr:aminotransferase class V-fold PLP-dependent enzyme [Phycisphaerales bacterium]